MKLQRIPVTWWIKHHYGSNENSQSSKKNKTFSVNTATLCPKSAMARDSVFATYSALHLLKLTPWKQKKTTCTNIEQCLELFQTQVECICHSSSENASHASDHSLLRGREQYGKREMQKITKASRIKTCELSDQLRSLQCAEKPYLDSLPRQRPTG